MMQSIWIYLGLFLGVFIEGEFIFISAVVASSHGHLNFWVVLVIAIVSTMTSDMTYFHLGKNKSTYIMSKPKWKERIEKLNHKIEAHRNLVLFSYRFLYGFRMATPFVLGTQNLTYATFLKYSFLGTMLWAILFSVLGYSFGELLLQYFNHIKHIEIYVIIGFLILMIIFQVYKRFNKKRNSNV